ncbi:hypothetical protein K7X08_015156 [Anisodus acutangulus]|uniref:Uncharacterized protein n=1 Tax=Anisodus acutangulus TaxID=402998 RepID=A0A9Q1L3M0_9SOLA|nr:hypothetical protein K7X08_015156 [Anisodus acutangulus]
MIKYRLLEKDPFQLKCTLVHLAAAMELGHSNELYLMACNLVKDSQGLCHGLLSVATTIVSRNMTKHAAILVQFRVIKLGFEATSLDGTFASAWIGYGNAYAAQEGDQTMSAYRTAARLFPGYHLPTLYIGMEYMRTHSFKLAEQFFMQAESICPSDPLVYNELGVA